jgi:hypothetical protein
VFPKSASSKNRQEVFFKIRFRMICLKNSDTVKNLPLSKRIALTSAIARHQMLNAYKNKHALRSRKKREI